MRALVLWRSLTIAIAFSRSHLLLYCCRFAPCACRTPRSQCFDTSSYSFAVHPVMSCVPSEASYSLINPLLIFLVVSLISSSALWTPLIPAVVHRVHQPRDRNASRGASRYHHWAALLFCEVRTREHIPKDTVGLLRGIRTLDSPSSRSVLRRT